MSALITDFINIEILAQAVASKIKLETSISKRVFNLDEAAAYCGLTRDSFKKKWSAIGYKRSPSISVGASTRLIWMPGSMDSKTKLPGKQHERGAS
jgi:hypothetical protein